MEKHKNKGMFFKKDVMPIAGYYGPYQLVDESTGTAYEFIKKNIYEKIREAGLNLIVRCDNDYESQPQIVLDNLAMAEKYGIGVFVTDSRIKNLTEDSNLQECFEEFERFSSFKGIFVIDEPCSETYYPADQWEKGQRLLKDYAKISSKLNESEDYVGYINLYPMYDFMARKNDADTDYRAYLEEYLDTCNPKLISYDMYPFDHYLYPKILGLDITGVNQGYFRNLSVVRELSLKRGIPFWHYVQAGSNWNDSGQRDLKTVNDTPTESQMLWNINTALAYGAKGIQYFPLVQPYVFAYSKDGQYDYKRNGLIGANGEPTQWYDYAKQANQFIAEVDEILMACTSEKILAVGTKAQTETGIQEDTDELLETVFTEKDALIGVFNYQGKKAYYVVNYDMDTKNIIHMNFVKEKNISMYVMNGKNYEFEDVKTSISLLPGRAALVIVQ